MVLGKETRFIEQPGLFGGKRCKGNARRSCIQKSCPLNCMWSEWGPCSATCGPGIQRRNFVNLNRHDIYSCHGHEKRNCNQRPCLVIKIGKIYLSIYNFIYLYPGKIIYSLPL